MKAMGYTMASIRFDFEGIKRNVTFYISCLSNFLCMYNLNIFTHTGMSYIVILILFDL